MAYGERVNIKHINPKIAHHGAHMPRSGQRVAYKGEPISVWAEDAKWLIDKQDNPEWEYADKPKPNRKRAKKSKAKVDNG